MRKKPKEKIQNLDAAGGLSAGAAGGVFPIENLQEKWHSGGRSRCATRQFPWEGYITSTSYLVCDLNRCGSRRSKTRRGRGTHSSAFVERFARPRCVVLSRDGDYGASENFTWMVVSISTGSPFR